MREQDTVFMRKCIGVWYFISDYSKTKIIFYIGRI